MLYLDSEKSIITTEQCAKATSGVVLKKFAIFTRKSWFDISTSLIKIVA